MSGNIIFDCPLLPQSLSVALVSESETLAKLVRARQKVTEAKKAA